MKGEEGDRLVAITRTKIKRVGGSKCLYPSSPRTQESLLRVQVLLTLLASLRTQSLLQNPGS